MKYKTTKKEMRNMYGKNLVYVPSGTMQIFDWILSPNSYSTRVEGWACDYYELGSICISEGDSPVGKRAMDYEECLPFRKATDDFYDRYVRGEITADERKQLLQNLLNDFVGTIEGKLERKEIK